MFTLRLDDREAGIGGTEQRDQRNCQERAPEPIRGGRNAGVDCGPKIDRVVGPEDRRSTSERSAPPHFHATGATLPRSFAWIRDHKQ
ncbi:hypothetical protein K438DRAFT_1826147 [Mycena galopus ATCC 62051]|nr:hypothetical protein K438DRAFT_1884375 [Mycena galopus ATCC 62051]KAF8195356.1 hypothetical protein K438DRAFT_1827317 [Mycena galopus ATCC 62051]KAF8196384.1 hypothetical protein K438DRAFT_1826147 [Mycena galopus ATCC 62051]